MKTRYTGKGITIALALLTTLNAAAQDINYQQAAEIASNFLQGQGIASSTNTLRKAKGAENTANSPVYIINDANAFVVVAGDSRVNPIMAYSLEGTYDADNLSPAAAELIQGYEQYVQAVIDGMIEPAPLRLTLSQNKVLETATWDQNGSPWYDQCPQDGYSHTVGGCVATAMSIIMRYHSWPVTTGYGSKTYTTESLNRELSANFGETDYHIADIPVDGTNASSWDSTTKGYAARLIADAGVAANMNYGTTGSSASNLAGMVGLHRYFGYTLGGMLTKADYEDNVDDYIQVIVDEIDAGRPMLYIGDNTTEGGHMYICDGYNTSGQLHFNFGWSGSGNGFYTITENFRFQDHQQAILGIEPERNRTAPASLYFPCVGDARKGLWIPGNGIVKRGSSFQMVSSNLFNVADADLTGLAFATVIRRANGDEIFLYSTPSQYSINNEMYWTTMIHNGSIPADYEYAEGDKLCLYYSLDNGTTWQKTESADSSKSEIDMKDAYDPEIVNLVMITISGETPGLVETSQIKVDGTAFTVTPTYLYNLSTVKFNGKIAIYLCDSKGNKKLNIGEKDLSLAYQYYTNHSISCRIPVGTEIESGDRLMAFAQMAGESTWVPVECADASKAYILMPESMVSQQTTISFSQPIVTYCNAKDLDFSSVSNFKAFTLSMINAETLALNRVYELKGGEGVLLWGVNAQNGEYSDVAQYMTDAQSHSDNLLVGVLEDTVVGNDETENVTNYVFAERGADIGFYVAQGETVAAGEAYLCIPGAPQNAPLHYSFVINDDTNGIITVTSDESVSDLKIYNLQGIEVTNPVPGFYIINGRKVIIR